MPRRVRPIRVCGDVAYVPLTQGREAIIDANRISLVRHWNWNFSRQYAKRQQSGNSIYLHRVILMPPSSLVVDHINGDGLDCRISNLRACTNQQNCSNQRISKNNTTGFKGVVRRGERFETSIRTGSKRIHLGTYDTPEEAHDIYCRASEKYHGEFGRTS
jgi:hypothetical protein